MFWATGFWATGFWATDFWQEGDGPEPPPPTGAGRAYRREIIILDGATTPARAVHLGQYTLTGLIIPADFEGATITFTASETEGGSQVPVHLDTGAALSLAVAASRAVALTAAQRDALAPWPWIKPVVNVAQTGDVALMLVLKRQGAP